MEKTMNGREVGSMMTVVAFICFEVLLCSSSVDAQSTTFRPTTAPCSRLLMKGIDNDNLPWLQIAGIYHLANFTVDLFPVYKHESTNTYFYYNGSAKELRFGVPYQNTVILVWASTNGRTSSVVYYSTKPFNPFYNLITGWYQYEPISHRYVSLSGGKQRIEPTCISDDVITCSSGMLEFDDNLKQINKYPRTAIDLNILGLDYYKQLPGLYSNNRPIYTRIRGNLDTQLYLFYVDGYWLVGYDYTEARSVIIAEDYSSRPEHILGTWSIYTNGKIIAVNAKLKCRASGSPTLLLVKIMSNTSSPRIRIEEVQRVVVSHETKEHCATTSSWINCPYDDARLYLETTRCKDNDYINAVYVDGYRSNETCILTQFPLRETIVDFWRMIWDYQLKSIVMLDDIESGDKVSLIHKHKGPLTVRHYQVNGWGDNANVPSSPNLFLGLMDQLTGISSKVSIIIQCTDGATRSGLFAAAMYVIDMMKTEAVVDVFVACRFIAINRPQVINSQEQYEFLYELASSHMNDMQDYSNCSPKFLLYTSNADSVYANA